MKNMTAASRITFGLVCSMLGILMGANMLGLFSDRNEFLVQGRAQMTESLAFSTVVLLASDDLAGVDVVLKNTLARQPQIRSIGIRRAADRVLISSAGNHDELWPKDLEEKSQSQFMQLPLTRESGVKWGTLEVCFESSTWFSFLQNSIVTLMAFVAISGFISFRIFLRFVLKNLDPSKAVPRRVREALDILNEGLMILGLDDRILLANNALARTAQRSADSLVGRKASELTFQRRDKGNVMPWTECGQTEQSVSGVTLDFADSQGIHRIFKANCSPLFGNEGKIRGVMVSLDDVTQLEQNKVELKLAKDEADAANKAKGDFLANMSHEIRNPMNAIVGFTDILRRGLEDSEATRTSYLNTIHASGTHLVELINDILDFSKIEAGKLELEIRDCSPYQIMTEVMNVLRMKAEQQSLNLSLSIRGEIPETIQSDSTRLRQVLMNLVGNAIKFTSEGGVKIVASMTEQHGQPAIRFEVTDTGIGMTKEQMGRLFQEFMQADSSVTRRFGGTGLGLAISKRLTEAMGGQIAVDSEVGVGSTFHFCVATGAITGVAMLDQKTAVERFASAAQTRKQGLKIWFKPARILVTDDTPANRQLAGLVLRKAGLTVDEAENGAIAVEKASSGSYDLMLMDMQMPVMDGFTATRTLRAQGLTTPILAFTANVMEQDRQRCVAAGCSGFLTKPINIDLLLSTLSEYLPTQDAPPELVVETPPVSDGKLVAPIQESGNYDAPELPATAISGTEGSLNFIDDLINRLSLETSVAPTATAESVIDRKPSLKQETKRTHRPPIHSTLPLEISEFREIVESFVGSIHDTMAGLRTAQRAMDYQEIREVAHRLKGTGGTVGFSDFTEPSRKLQMAAEQRDDRIIEAMLCELEEISERIQIPVAV